MDDKFRNMVCELLGTFALTFIGAGAILTTTWTGGAPGLVGIALAHGLVLGIVVTATMNLSGGHINPAVTIAMLFTGRIKIGDAIGYIIAQVAGATIAGFILAAIFNSMAAGAGGITGTEAIANCMLGTPNFGAYISSGMALFVEILLTFMLVVAIFGTAVDGRSPGVAGFGIGLAVTVDILMGGPITGAAMNPARTIGTLIGGGGATSSLWAQHWVYWVGPVVGALVAAFMYDLLILKSSKS